MHKSIRTLVTLFAAALTLGYVGMMAYRYNYTPYKTETLLTYSMDDSCTVQAAFIRSEQLISSVSGVVNYRVQNGAMVLKGTVVADVFARDSDIERREQIAALEQEIDHLETAQYAVHSEINTVSAIGAQIEEQMLAVARAAAYGRLDGLSGRSQSLTFNLNRRQIAVGREANFAERIDRLDAELSFLLRDAAPAIGSVTVPVTGYFSSKTDGFEADFSADSYLDLDDEAVARLILGRMTPTGPLGAGKVVTTHNYYLAALVDDEVVARFKVGAQLRLDFPHSEARGISARVMQSRPLVEGGYIVYLRLSNISDYLLAQRTASVSVKFDTVTGLRLPASALRYQGSQAGTYVLVSGRIVFKPIHILFEEAGYVLCQPADATGTAPLKMYDQVIVEGTDLYDGKVVG